jgi:hypothetical protein
MKKLKFWHTFSTATALRLWIFLTLLGIVVVMLFSLLFRFVFSHPVVAEIPLGKGRTASEKFIQINILNGAGEKKIASKAMDYFRNRGFDVVEINNYEMTVEQSFVIDRVGDLNSAQQVAFALGVPDSTIQSDIDSSLYLRCSVVLGKNYKTLKPFR